ncbi:hypothetical protein [Halalkalicoccus salilacus]|uniref:hypothetical protein n=1 Tax=Halalkalicoccus sp. GCM10025704 TaxID=3252662 RepID=UPI00361E9327
MASMALPVSTAVGSFSTSIASGNSSLSMASGRSSKSIVSSTSVASSRIVQSASAVSITASSSVPATIVDLNASSRGESSARRSGRWARVGQVLWFRTSPVSGVDDPVGRGSPSRSVEAVLERFVAPPMTTQ